MRRLAFVFVYYFSISCTFGQASKPIAMRVITGIVTSNSKPVVCPIHLIGTTTDVWSAKVSGKFTIKVPKYIPVLLSIKYADHNYYIRITPDHAFFPIKLDKAALAFSDSYYERWQKTEGKSYISSLKPFFKAGVWREEDMAKLMIDDSIKELDERFNYLYEADRTQPQTRFKGGPKAMIDFIKTNIQHPEDVRTGYLEGFVSVSFNVEKDGSLSKIELTGSLSDECDEEALRLVKLFPKCDPGMIDGKPVKTSAMVNIVFPATKYEEGVKYSTLSQK